MIVILTELFIIRNLRSLHGVNNQMIQVVVWVVYFGFSFKNVF